MTYPLAERFKAPQGEGLFSGVQMAFMRLVGCSVGQGVCTACDTDFDKVRPELGGGVYTPEELAMWAHPCDHACLTGGEPLDRDLRDLLFELEDGDVMCHVETSGTRRPDWLGPRQSDAHLVLTQEAVHEAGWLPVRFWLTVSPKPGYLPDMIEQADEIKLILGGLGDGPGWPTLTDAVRWADAGKLVYVQPKNERNDVDRHNLDLALLAVDTHPQLRLSVQLHKFVRTR